MPHDPRDGEASIADYAHHGEDAPWLWAAENSGAYDGEPNDDPYDDYEDWS